MKILCKIFHHWTNRNGSSRDGHSNETCRRCGMNRDYYGTGGQGCYGEPYPTKSAHDLKRSVEIANEMVKEIWELRNENAKPNRDELASEVIRVYRERCIKSYGPEPTGYQKGVIQGLDCALSFLPNVDVLARGENRPVE